MLCSFCTTLHYTPQNHIKTKDVVQVTQGQHKWVTPSRYACVYVCVCCAHSYLMFSLLYILSLSHTHTHTHTYTPNHTHSPCTASTRGSTMKPRCKRTEVSYAFEQTTSDCSGTDRRPSRPLPPRPWCQGDKCALPSQGDRYVYV
jgi:hypothetical protein